MVYCYVWCCLVCTPDNQMAEDVAPVLQQMLSNLTDVDSSIATAMDMVTSLNYLRLVPNLIQDWTNHLIIILNIIPL